MRNRRGPRPQSPFWAATGGVRSFPSRRRRPLSASAPGPGLTRRGNAMRRLGWCALVLGLVVQAYGQDPPKDDKKPPPKERYDALVKEFNAARQKLIPEINKAKGEEQKKLLDQYYGLGKEYAEKFYMIAEEAPKDPVAADALIWVLQNGDEGPVEPKAADEVAALVAETLLKDLTERLNTLRSAPNPVLEAALKRAEKEEADPLAGELLAWVVTSGPYQPTASKAA